jgi:DNA invertase Pin-like site-specific DNA recombinase
MSSAAVCYAAKSTADERGSIPTQLADCRAAAEAEDREVVAEYQDEAFIAYKGNRGPGLEQAMARTLTAGKGCELWVQHSDRLARGDGKQAKHLLHYALWALEHDVKLRSVQDPQTFSDLLYTAVTGQRNTEDSDRKSKATAAGLKRRKDRGEPVGAVPYGYRPLVSIDTDGQVRTSRSRDTEVAHVVERIFAMVEAGHTFGDVARALNADGLLTRRGKQWTTRAVRRMVLNPDYTGSTGYPQLIDPGRWQRINDGLKRLDPVTVQTRKGGRRPAEDYMLRGVGFCGHCGASLYTRRYSGFRHYICAAVREARGTCDAKPIPAGWVEQAVIEHLDQFTGALRGWLNTRLA